MRCSVLSLVLPSLALSCLAPSVGFARGGGIRLTDSLTMEYRTDNENGQADDDDYGVIINRLNIQANADQLSTFARIDVMKFIDTPPIPEGSARFEDDARLERLRAQYTLGNWKLTAGDFYQQLGRGIMLSLRKVDELGLDLAIRGGRATYSGDDFDISGFVGRVNPAQLDVVSQRFVEDSDDILSGGRIAFRPGAGVTIGALTLDLRPDSQSVNNPIVRESLGISTDDASQAVGMFLEVPELTEQISIYAEADYQQRRIADRVSTGHAAYATIDFLFDSMSILVEGMQLSEYELLGSPNSALNSPFRYTNAPTLERIDQIVDNVDNVTGGRVYIEPFFLDGDLILHVNGMLRFNDPGLDSEIRQVHTFGGVKYLFQGGRSRLALSGGWREERHTDDERLFRGIRHGEVDYLQSIGGGYAMHLQVRNDLRQQEDPQDDIEPVNFVWNSTLLSIEKASLWSLTFEFGIDTQDKRDDVRQYFYAGIVDLHLDSVLKAWGVDDLEPILMRITVGNQRGGIKCIAGICRDFPEFSGARLNVVARHTLGG